MNILCKMFYRSKGYMTICLKNKDVRDKLQDIHEIKLSSQYDFENELKGKRES